jgi:hypothetical protein
LPSAPGASCEPHVERDRHVHRSRAVAEVLTDQMTWTHLTDDAPGNWWHTTQTPQADVDAATVLGPLAQRLLNRAAEVLAPPPPARILSTLVFEAVSALLATTHGYNGECRIDQEDIAWANTHGGALHIIEHDDGTVTFTKEHRDQCPFVISSGTQDCDEDCYFIHPADMDKAGPHGTHVP